MEEIAEEADESETLVTPKKARFDTAPVTPPSTGRAHNKLQSVLVNETEVLPASV